MSRNKKRQPDFGGYATKFGIKCTDGRVIDKRAFVAHNGTKVPLVWAHMHDDPTAIVGHGILSLRKDGMYVEGFFNGTQKGKHMKESVQHGDIDSLSIYANHLIHEGNRVVSGSIKEVSLVIAGANSEARIDAVEFAHADGTFTEDETEAVITFNIPFDLSHSDEEDEFEDDKSEEDDEIEEDSDADLDDDLQHADDETIADVLDTFNEKQQTVLYALIAQALGGDVSHSNLNLEGVENMKKNIFDNNGGGDFDNRPTLTHDDLKSIVKKAEQLGSYKNAFLAHVEEYGITNIDYLFPDARNLQNEPHLLKRDTEWVTKVFNQANHTPFSRVRTLIADITADEARAKGYVKGTKKIEEVLVLLKRVTNPTTVYKKQKLNRDDVIDATELAVIAWLKKEMRLMLEEEIARAALVGDGRSIAAEDKINEENIRPIYKDDELYAPKFILAENIKPADLGDSILRNRKEYKGSGSPTFFTTADILADLLLQKDTTGRRIYDSVGSLATALRVSEIVEVPVMENMTREVTGGVHDGKTVELLGIVVNMKDYTYGADKGGEVSMFDDFDIDFNQLKYLIETRCSGALTIPKSALVFERVVDAGTGEGGEEEPQG